MGGTKVPLFTICLVLALSSLMHADMKISARTIIDHNQPMDTTVYLKEDSMRLETVVSPGTTIINITQCGEGQIIQINERTKTYLVTPIAQESPSRLRSRDSDDQSPNQATANFVEELRDTGERKDYFRRTARHLTVEFASAAERPACMNYLQASVDGWYIDIPWPACARSPAEEQLRSAVEGCAEELHFKVSGNARLGFPVVEDETLSAKTSDAELIHKIHREVSKMENLPVDARLFQIPTSYREVNSFEELMGAPGGVLASNLIGMATMRPTAHLKEGPSTFKQGTPAGEADAAAKLADKKPGVLRLGVAQVTSSVAQPASLSTLQGKIIAGLQAAAFEAVPLTTNPDDHDGLEAEAKSKGCDYYVTSDIGALKQSTARGTPRTTAQIAVKAYLPDQIRPVLDGGNNYTGGDIDSTLESLLKEEVHSIASEIKKVRR
jgi:hypothetical protein